MTTNNKDEVISFLEEKCGFEESDIPELKMAINVYLRGKGTSLQGLTRTTSSYSTLKKIAGEWTKDPEKIGKIASAMHTETSRPRSPVPTQPKIPKSLVILAKKINHNPASIARFTLEELKEAAECDPNILAKVLNRPLEKTISIQELYKREVERRTERNVLEKRLTGFSSGHLAFPK